METIPMKYKSQDKRKVLLKQRLEGGEGISQADIVGGRRVFWARETAGALGVEPTWHTGKEEGEREHWGQLAGLLHSFPPFLAA